MKTQSIKEFEWYEYYFGFFLFPTLDFDGDSYSGFEITVFYERSAPNLAKKVKIADVEWHWIIPLFGSGLMAGLLGGLLGIGGGILFIVVLPLFFSGFGVSDQEIVAYTIANSLFSTLFTSVSGNIKHLKDNNFHLKPVVFISVPAVLASFFLLHFFVNSHIYSKSAFQLFFLAILLLLIFRMGKKQLNPKPKTEGGIGENSHSNWGYLYTGLGAGAVSALTGLGGGVFIVPVLHSLLHLPMRKANSVSLGVITITSLSSGIVSIIAQPVNSILSFQVGYLVFPVVFLLGSGGMVGSIFGVELSKKLNDQWSGRLFIIFLLLIFLFKSLEIVGK